LRYRLRPRGGWQERRRKQCFLVQGPKLAAQADAHDALPDVIDRVADMGAGHLPALYRGLNKKPPGASGPGVQFKLLVGRRDYYMPNLYAMPMRTACSVTLCVSITGPNVTMGGPLLKVPKSA